MQNLNLEEIIFSYIDKVKFLISPKTWENVLLDCSKNEIFILFYIYRKQEANMSQLAEYVEVPLNTVTGIVDRMEKKSLLTRQRSPEDKRVVTVCMTEEGLSYVSDVLKVFLEYAQIVIEKLTSEEVAMIFRISDKVVAILEESEKKRREESLHLPKKESKVRRIEIE